MKAKINVNGIDVFLQIYDEKMFKIIKKDLSSILENTNISEIFYADPDKYNSIFLFMLAGSRSITGYISEPEYQKQFDTEEKRSINKFINNNAPAGTLSIAFKENVFMNIITGKHFVFKKNKPVKCYLCDKPAIFEHLLCAEHITAPFCDTGNYSSRNGIIQDVKLPTTSLSKDFTFSIEFEISYINRTYRRDIRRIMGYYRFLETDDSTADAGEYKSPIYKGFVNIEPLKVFDRLIKNDLIELNSSTGTHLNIGKLDENDKMSKLRDLTIEEQKNKKSLLTYFVNLEMIMREGIYSIITGREIGGTYYQGYLPNGAPENKLNNRTQWVNITQSHGQPVVEFRVAKFKNTLQYTKMVFLSLFIYKQIEKILFKNGNVFTELNKFEKYYKKLYQKFTNKFYNKIYKFSGIKFKMGILNNNLKIEILEQDEHLKEIPFTYKGYTIKIARYIQIASDIFYLLGTNNSNRGNIANYYSSNAKNLQNKILATFKARERKIKKMEE